MKESKHEKPNGQKNTHLIVLSAVSALVALLLFLDAVVPVFPKSVELPDWGKEPDGDREGVDIIGGGAETDDKKSWWENLFDKKDPDDPIQEDVSLETEQGEPVPRPTPVIETDYYTYDETVYAFHDDLTNALTELSHMESRGEILPIVQIGIFNIDNSGMPEIVLLHEVGGSQSEYTVYEMISLELLTSWSSMGQNDDLAVWIMNGDSYASLFIHDGNGDDHYICELETTDRVRYMERAAMIRDGSTVTYRLDGRKTNEAAYRNAVSDIEDGCSKLSETTLRLSRWYADADMSIQAKLILGSGQKFIRTLVIDM